MTTTNFILRETVLVRGGRYDAAARHAARWVDVDPRLVDGFCEVAARRLAYTPPESAYVRNTIQSTAADFGTIAARWWYLGEQRDFAHLYLPERGPVPVLAVLRDGSAVDYRDEEPHADWTTWLDINRPDEWFEGGEPLVVKVAGDPDAFWWLVEALREAGWAVEVEVRG
jgi:hypothetical protein